MMKFLKQFHRHFLLLLLQWPCPFYRNLSMLFSCCNNIKLSVLTLQVCPLEFPFLKKFKEHISLINSFPPFREVLVFIIQINHLSYHWRDNIKMIGFLIFSY